MCPPKRGKPTLAVPAAITLAVPDMVTLAVPMPITYVVPLHSASHNHLHKTPVDSGVGKGRAGEAIRRSQTGRRGATEANIPCSSGSDFWRAPRNFESASRTTSQPALRQTRTTSRQTERCVNASLRSDFAETTMCERKRPKLMRKKYRDMALPRVLHPVRRSNW